MKWWGKNSMDIAGFRYLSFKFNEWKRCRLEEESYLCSIIISLKNLEKSFRLKSFVRLFV